MMRQGGLGGHLAGKPLRGGPETMEEHQQYTEAERLRPAFLEVIAAVVVCSCSGGFARLELRLHETDLVVAVLEDYVEFPSCLVGPDLCSGPGQPQAVDATRLADKAD